MKRTDIVTMLSLPIHEYGICICFIIQKIGTEFYVFCPVREVSDHYPSENFFSPAPFPLSFQGSDDMNAMPFIIFPRVPETLFIFFSPFSFCYPDCVISTVQSSSGHRQICVPRRPAAGACVSSEGNSNSTRSCRERCNSPFELS